MPESRNSILERLRQKVAAGLPIIGGGAGTGISAKCEEAGGIDLIVIYNSGRFRMAGRGSLAGLMPYGNANAIVKEMAFEVLTTVRHTPVLAGVCATDPFMIRDLFLCELKEMGFAGNPELPDRRLDRRSLCESISKRLAWGSLPRSIASPVAHELEPSDDTLRLRRGTGQAPGASSADIVVAHMGLTTRGSIGARTAKTLDDCVQLVTAIAEAGKTARSDLLVLCHGGPIASPDDAQYVLKHAGAVDGFYGASSMERLPTELAIERVAILSG